MQVTYKSTQLLDDQVLVKGFAAGGLSDMPREAFDSCSMAQTLAQASALLPLCSADCEHSSCLQEHHPKEISRAGT